MENSIVLHWFENNWNNCLIPTERNNTATQSFFYKVVNDVRKVYSARPNGKQREDAQQYTQRDFTYEKKQRQPWKEMHGDTDNG